MPLWFRSKTYGYGWTPATWQGWLVLFSYITLSLGTFFAIDAYSHSTSDSLIAFLPLVLLYTFALIFICMKKGEKPRWRWGEENNEK